MKRANPFVFMLFSAIIGASAQELRLGANESSNAFVPLMERVLADAGMRVSTTSLPTPRAVKSVSIGELDGLFFVSEETLKTESGLRAVPVVLLELPFIAIAADQNLTASSPEELSGKTVGIVRTDTASLRRFAGADIVLVPDYVSLTKMFEQKRFDVAIIAAPNARFYPQFLNAKILFTVHTVPYFLALSVRRPDLAGPVEKALKAWVLDGRWGEEVKRVMNR